MEPAVELALRVVAHLWVLRRSFPAAQTCADLPLDWKEHLIHQAQTDIAQAQQIYDVCEPPVPTKQRRRSEGTQQPLQRFLDIPESAAKRKWGVLHVHGGSEDPKKAAKSSCDKFASQLDTLGIPKDALRFRSARRVSTDKATDYTRDQAIRDVANLLLADRKLMGKVAAALNYTPELVEQTGLQKEHLEHWTDPLKLMRIADERAIPVPFSMVLREELEEIVASRQLRIPELLGHAASPNNVKGCAPAKAPTRLADEEAAALSLFGLCVSGGGIRSATFALGVLQAMADSHLLALVDYLSTVSGGGYIGAWLTAWTKRRGSIVSVQESMRGCGGESNAVQNLDPMTDDVRPIRYLREFSRYLAPQAGFFSADTWTILSTWMRNTILNLIGLTLFLAGLLMLPRVAAAVLLALPRLGWGAHATAIAGGALLLLACFFIAWRSLRSFRQRRSPKSELTKGDTEPVIVGSIVTLIFGGSFLTLGALWVDRGYKDMGQTAVMAGALYLVGIFSLWAIPLMFSGAPLKSGLTSKDTVLAAVWVVISASAGLALVLTFCKFLEALAYDTELGTWIAITAGLAGIVGILGLVVTIFIGLMGTNLSEEQREWWARMGAWISIFAVGWLGLAAISFFAPLWIAKLGAETAVLGIGWGAITWSGVKLAFSPRTGGDGGENQTNSLLTAIMHLAPYAFVAGFLVAISFGLYLGAAKALEFASIAKFFSVDPFAHALCCITSPFTLTKMIAFYWPLMHPASWFPLAACILLFASSLLFTWRVDVNEFSMHNLYKNRLVRAYLGASRARLHRWPNAFTSFDLDDDFPLARLRTTDSGSEDDRERQKDAWTDCRISYVGPLQVVNTALNVTRGEDPSMQERKASSFFFTPLRAGFDFSKKQAAEPETTLVEYGFRPTWQYAYPDEGGISVGTAIAISGAAASPNAGFHTTPALAFLLTVFNVRLGWWVGNTVKNTWKRSSPVLGLTYLLCELTGQTQTDRKYLQLSDGGHFDNMGLYEMVRRRCRFVVVCDGEEDAEFRSEGIGLAIRKCRIDFGVAIVLDLNLLKPLPKTGISRMHYAVGTVIYPESTDPGIILYLKATLTGDEPIDVVEFHKTFPAFPNQSTANQFFDESHFESYRALGHHIGQGIFKKDAIEALQDNQGHLSQTLTEIFNVLSTRYYEEVKKKEKI